MKLITTRPIGLDFSWLHEMKAQLDELDRVLDDPRIAEQDRFNSLPDPPEPEDDATGSTR